MDGKINATIGIVKCPRTGNLYGVRIEIKDNKKWIATWAFPIKPEVAKREGYTENQFPPDILYDRDYPGCPYCEKKEDLAAITKPESKKELQICVSTPCYDNIGQILDSLKIKYSQYNAKKFDCDVLFLNCGTTDKVDTGQLRKFVENGGCVYASDLTDSIMVQAFPNMFRFKGHDGKVCKIYANVVDKELNEIIGNRVQIEFDLPSWAVLQSSTGATLLSGASGSEYSGLPIMIKASYGKGIIFYTCFHNHAQASEKERALLQLLVLKQFGSNANKSLAQAGKDLGVDVDKIKSKFRSNW